MIAAYSIILGVFFILSFLFSATETAYTSLSEMQIKQLAQTKGRAGRRLEKLYRKTETALTTLLIGNNIVNLGASALATIFTIELFGNQYVGLATGILTLVVLVFCEVTPKQIALVRNEQICLFMAGPLMILSYVLWPLVFLITGISRIFTRLFTPGNKNIMSIDHILHMFHYAENLGIVGSHERDIVKKTLRIKQITAESIMTHRKDVFCLDYESTITEAWNAIIKEGYTRIPLYQDHSENIVGVVLLKDLIREKEIQGGGLPLKELMLRPIFITENKRADDLFFQFKKEKLNMAIVLDEYGGLAGLVTQEDVVEVLLGELYDENEKREAARIKKLNKDSWLVMGDADFYDIQDAIGLTLEHDRSIKTISGYLTEKLQKLPEEGQKLELPEGIWEIMKRDKTRILEVCFKINRKNEPD
jgi:CBS domain containing-hemolysin-like protein